MVSQDTSLHSTCDQLAVKKKLRGREGRIERKREVNNPRKKKWEKKQELRE